MKRWIATTIVVYSIILASTVQAGGLLQKLYFVGLWQGIDTVDGSEAQRSITLNRDGTYNIAGREGYFSACDGARGILNGTGALENGVLFFKNFEVTCFYEESVESRIIPVKYIPDKLNSTLRERFIDEEDIRTTYHKVSNR
jgi:hypothetical protein